MTKIQRIEHLLENFAEAFEYVEHSKIVLFDDEIIHLNVAINNLLYEMKYYYEQLNSGNFSHRNFISCLFLSSPVFFDFLFSTRVNNQMFVGGYQKQAYYNDARLWYRFIRNSLIHGFRFDQNHYIENIFRIDYNDCVTFDFQLKQGNAENFNEFRENRFVRKNTIALLDKQIKWNYRFLNLEQKYAEEDIVVFQLEYDFFIDFLLKELENYYGTLETLVNSFKQKEMKNWNHYFDQFYQLIKQTNQKQEISVSNIKEHLINYQNFNIIDTKYVFELVQLLVFLGSFAPKLTNKELLSLINQIVDNKLEGISNFDFHEYQLEDEVVDDHLQTLLTNRVFKSKVTHILRKLDILSEQQIKDLKEKEAYNKFINITLQITESEEKND
ncbi:MAG: hypothetical protein ACRCUP_05710 [Mycoplasmatales bacterium]